MDLIHTVTKVFDHNRWTAITASVLVAVAMVPGCSMFDQRVPSSHSGEVLSADELNAEYTQAQSELQSRYDIAAAKASDAESEMQLVLRDSETLAEGFQIDAEAVEAERAAFGEVVGGVVNMIPAAQPFQWILPLLGVGGVGVAGGTLMDNRRKDRVIKQVKEPKAAQ